MYKALFVLTIAASTSAYADGKIIGTVEAKPSKLLKDSIVYVQTVPGVKLTAKTVEIDQKAMAFTPHIALLAVGDTVKFQNHDKVDHNVRSTAGGYDLGTWGAGQEREHTFKTEGVFPQVCKLHPEMLAYVFVGQNRFAAIVDDSGNFAIDGIPAGTYELAIWNPKLKAAPQKVTVANGPTTTKFSLTR